MSCCEGEVFFLELREQPHVLDGDHGLVREGLQEFCLPVGERPHLGTPDRDRAEGRAFAHQGDAEDRSEVQGARERTAFGVLADIGLNVCDLDRPSFEHGTPAGRCRRQRTEGADGVRENRTFVSDQAQHVAIDAKHGGVEGVAQACRTRQDGHEHRLDIGGRARDHTQDLSRRRLLLERLGQHAIFRPLPLQTLRQALLQFATLGGFLLRRLAGDRSPGFNLSLCGLCSPTHRPLLTSYRRYDRAEIDDRLGERALVGKSKVEYSMLRASVQEPRG